MSDPFPDAFRAREPIFNMPGVVTGLLVILLGAHALRTLVLSDDTDVRLLLELALIPARWALALDPARAADLLREASEEGSAAAALLQYLVAEDSAKPWSVLTYAGLHGSWAHVGLNAVWLAAFGTPVARRCGPARFLALLGFGTAAGGLAHALIHPGSVAPLIGASAGVSALMAAAVRFVFAPEPPFRARSRPALEPLGALLRNPRAALFLAIWFATNLLFGLLATPLGVVEASIAWEAHLGGFVVGLLLFPWFDPALRVPARA